MSYDREYGLRTDWRVVGAIFVIFLLIVGGMTCFDTVPPGYRGIRVRFGKPERGVLPEGLTFKIPVADKIEKLEVREMKTEEQSNAASKDMQTVNALVALNFQVIAEEADQLFVSIGPAYSDRVIIPALHEALKAVTAKFTAEELITKRESVRQDVEENLRRRFEGKHLRLISVAIKDFNFSQEFNRSIEEKQTEEQRALRARHELDRKRTEAQQQVVQAEAKRLSQIELAQGEAEAVRIRAKAEAEAIEVRSKAEAEALRLLGVATNDQALRVRALEKWDGVLPRVTAGEAMPFLDLGRYGAAEVQTNPGPPATTR